MFKFIVSFILLCLSQSSFSEEITITFIGKVTEPAERIISSKINNIDDIKSDKSRFSIKEEEIPSNPLAKLYIMTYY
ncbi:hypothetical protein C9J38_18380 [Photobacterium sp. GB-210]|nr:hypothetical protein C9J38_18380 [Photobacterium sp. GB-210]PSV55981.1 hypothetical protein C9J43_13835 [Photobacterium sp. GB-3]